MPGKATCPADNGGGTVRQKILTLLEKGPASTREISQAAGIREKDVPFYLASIEKSLRRQNRRLSVIPWACLSCEFEFSKRQSYGKPGKCPVCGKSRITAARFEISGK